ncbi:MAG: Arc family DNA-binding protein [Clostridia bacterium]|nr:Arc family DNA-binding protein [Clostridia bacterium]
MNDKRVSLRLDPETGEKVKYIAKKEVRSINQQIICRIRLAVEEYEKQNGKITTDGKT